MDKVAPFLQKDKGLDLKEHMVEIEEMAQLGADGNFDTLNCREYNMAEMAIKFIKHLCLLKSATRFKDVILSIFQKWIPVTTHSIVTDFAEPFFSFLFIGYSQTTLFKDANLISKRLNMLGIWYFVHDQIIKKAHPKRAVLREAG